MQYNPVILDHFHQPRHVGSLADGEGVFVGSAGSRARGDELRIYLKISNHCIQSACFRAYGGVATIACGSYLAEWLHGKESEQAKFFTAQQLMDALALPVTKRHAALLAEDALRQALYQA